LITQEVLLSRSFARLGIAVAAVALLAALFGTASAGAATVVNGGFETGNLENWALFQSNKQVTWEVAEEEGRVPPFSGTYYAFSNPETPGTAILYQDIALEPNSSHQLQLAFEYGSQAPISVPSPDSLVAEELGPANQQVRIDVMKLTAPITSLAPSDILATVFASSEGENLAGEGSEPHFGPRLLTADLSPFAGQTVRLRIAVAVNQHPLAASIDAVAVTSAPILPPVTPPQAPAPTPTPPTPSNAFTKGKLTLNKKTGSAFLSVAVPDAGTLTATDVHSKVAFASLAHASSKAKPAFVKSAAVTSTAAGTVKVPITPTAAAKEILAKKGKLAVQLKLTFVPTGGTAAVHSYSTKLVKTLKPARK
jgi:hypothetical protein